MGIQVEYDPKTLSQDSGWFPISRRFVSSSRWITSTPQAIKVMVYLIERASNPMNPACGDILEALPVIARGVGLSLDETQKALDDLASADEHSHSPEADGAFIVALEHQGQHIGWRLPSFDQYNPGARERSEARKAERRVLKAKRAIAARWDKARSAGEVA